jgi:hypothetical protein
MAERARDERKDKPEVAYGRFKRWKDQHPEEWKRIKRNSNLKREFGITLHDFDRMLEAQGFLCAICRSPLLPWPHLDHDHTTGRVREILCHHCNLAIGNVKDDPSRAEAVAAYLRKHGHEGT